MNHKLSRLEKRFRRISRQLTRFELQKLGPSEEKSLSLEEVVDDLEKHSGTSLFMGYYTHSGMMEVLRRYGIAQLLNDRGFSDLHLQMETVDTFRHMLQLYWGSEPDPDRLLVEIVLHEAVVAPRDGRSSMRHDVIFVEWLCLEDPIGAFDRERPRLPGQRKPGLGISAEIAQLLAIMAKRLRKDGLVNIPRYYHTAWGAQHAGFRFVRPETEGILNALARDVHRHSLAEASWAVELGLVSETESAEPFVWAGEEQVLATSERTKRSFASEEYTRRCLQTERSVAYVVDGKAYEHMRADIREGKLADKEKPGFSMQEDGGCL